MPRNTRIAFNKKALESLPLPAPGEKTRYFDERTPGLAVRVYGPARSTGEGGGRKTFIFLRRVQGQLGQLKLGDFPAMTVEQARGKASEHNAAIAAGKNPFEGARARREELTLGGLFDLYLEDHIRQYRKEKTAAAYRAIFDHRVKSLAGRRLSTLRRQDIAALHRDIGREAKVAANRVLTMLRGVFNWARRAELFQGENPAQGLERYREKTRERFLQPDEIPRFFEALSREENPTIRDFFLISLNTGARKSNVLAMRWDQVNFERATWTIPETKNGSAQVITLSKQAIEILTARVATREWVFPDATSYHPGSWRRLKRRMGLADLGCADETLQRMQWQELDLDRGIWTSPAGRKVLSPQAAGALRALLKTRDYVFPGTGDTGHLEEPKAGWKRLLERAGLQHEDREQRLRIHDLRRTLGSRQAALGTSLVIIGASLGHKSSEATRIYARLNQDPVRQSVQDALDDIYALKPTAPGSEVVELKEAAARRGR